MKIYVPYENINDYQCYVVYDKDTIRAYNSSPQYNTTSNYTDFFINSHYLTRQGQQTWNQYTNLPVCINSDSLTNDVFYRNDFDNILICLIIILIICFFFPYKIISRLFGRWLKL